MIIGAAVPSSASFAETVSLPRTTIATGTVAPPTQLTAAYRCYGWGVAVTLDRVLSTTQHGVTGTRTSYGWTAESVHTRQIAC